MSLSIRPVTNLDFLEWSQLWEGYNTFYKRTIAADITQTTWHRFLDHNEPMYVLVAERESKLVGFTHYLFHQTHESNIVAMQLYNQVATRSGFLVYRKDL